MKVGNRVRLAGNNKPELLIVPASGTGTVTEIRQVGKGANPIGVKWDNDSVPGSLWYEHEELEVVDG